jgi:chaperonin GroES
MTFKATYDNVIVKIIDEEKTTAGGIVLTGSNAKTCNRAKVMYAGEGLRTKTGVLIPTEVKVGDTVVFMLGIGMKITVDGEDMLLLKEDDIFGVEQ